MLSLFFLIFIRSIHELILTNFWEIDIIVNYGFQKFIIRMVSGGKKGNGRSKILKLKIRYYWQVNISREKGDIYQKFQNAVLLCDSSRFILQKFRILTITKFF